MRKLALVNQKGGSGKTTASINLAAVLVERGRRVLVIDLDPQASASYAIGLRGEEYGPRLLQCLLGPGSLSTCIRETAIPGLEVIPTSIALAEAELRLPAKVGGQMALQRKLSGLEPRWDYVLMDTPPSLGHLVVNALAAAEGVLVPLEPHALHLDGLALLESTIGQVRETLNPGLHIVGLFLCRWDPRTMLSASVVKYLDEKYPGLLFETRIRQCIRTAEAPSHGQPVTVYASNCTAAEDFRNLAAELEARNGNGRGQ